MQRIGCTYADLCSSAHLTLGLLPGVVPPSSPSESDIPGFPGGWSFIETGLLASPSNVYLSSVGVRLRPLDSVCSKMACFFITHQNIGGSNIMVATKIWN